MRLIVFAIGYLISLCCYAGAQSDLVTILNSIGSLQANFSQTVYGEHHQPLRQLSGQMMISRPNHFRWQIVTPIQQLTIADGQYIYVYDPDLKQLTKQTIKKGRTITPAMLLSGSSEGILNDFFTQEKKGWFILEPKFGDAVKQISLQFKGNKLIRMQFINNLDQITDIVFSKVKVNIPISKAKFVFIPPTGTDVVKISS